jgi:hypothetical protein
MINRGFTRTRTGTTFTLQSKDAYTYFVEVLQKNTASDGTKSDKTPAEIEDEFKVDTNRLGTFIISHSGSDAEIEKNDDSDVTFNETKEEIQKWIGPTTVDTWSLKKYLYILSCQTLFSRLVSIISQRLIGFREKRITNGTQNQTTIDIRNENSFTVFHKRTLIISALDDKNVAQEMFTIYYTFTVIVNAASATAQPTLDFTLTWDLGPAYETLKSEFQRYVVTEDTPLTALKDRGRLIYKIMKLTTPLSTDDQDSFPPSVEKTSDPVEASLRLMKEYFEYRETHLPLITRDTLREEFALFIKSHPPTSASRRGVDLIAKVDLQTENLTADILALFPASVLKDAKDKHKKIEDPQVALRLLIEDYEKSGTERGHYPYGSWAECLTPTCMIKKDPLDKQLQDTREGNLDKSSEKALEDAVKAWATSKGTEAEKTKLLDYAIQRQRLLDDETKKRAIHAGNSSRNTLPLVAPSSFALALP